MPKRLNKSGFTLVELLVAMAVSTIVLAMIYQAYIAQLKTHTTQQAVVEMQQNLRAALYLMEREIRLAGFNPLGTADVGFTDIANAQDDYIAFTMDYSEVLPPDGVDNDKDGIIDENPEPDGLADNKIRYELNANGQLLRKRLDDVGNIIDEGIVARGIDFIEFALLDVDGNATTVPEEVQSVRIQIDSSLPSGNLMVNGDGKDMSLISEVKCRNLGIN